MKREIERERRPAPRQLTASEYAPGPLKIVTGTSLSPLSSSAVPSEVVVRFTGKTLPRPTAPSIGEVGGK